MIVKQKKLSADSVIACYKRVFAELHKKRMTDSAINFISERSRNFCKTLETE